MPRGRGVRNLRVAFSSSNTEVRKFTFKGWGVAEVSTSVSAHVFEIYRPVPIPGKLYDRGIFVASFPTLAEAKKYITAAVLGFSRES
jgi:hypothetical protein